MDIAKYYLSPEDITTNFFHFTSYSNLKSITQRGLLPDIGHNARYIEKTKKVFFVESLDNLLILFDCWINIFYYMPRIPFIYTIGTHFLRQKWFPQFIADGYFGFFQKAQVNRKRAYKVFDQLLDDAVLLKLDLVENIDFSYDDIDEIKSRNYQKRHLEIMGYSPKYSSLETNHMDKWNLHCFSNHAIPSNKIALVYANNSYRLRDIFAYALKHTKLNLTETCPVLHGYLLYKNYPELDTPSSGYNL